MGRYTCRGPRLTLSIFLIDSPPYIPRQGLLPEPRAQVDQCLWSARSRDPPSPLLSVKTRQTTLPAQILCGFWGPKPEPSHLHDKHLLSKLSPQLLNQAEPNNDVSFVYFSHTDSSWEPFAGFGCMGNIIEGH